MRANSIFLALTDAYSMEKKNDDLNPKNLIGLVKHGGGGILMWGYMSASGLGSLVLIDGIMNHEHYLCILKDNLKISAQNLGIRDDLFFYQDNDPKHTAQRTPLVSL
ncbi:transposable element Tc1 transposase [Trichonephila clavipes]|nr:transposable element Tc1 transposase [Trichonephila clavipes]